MKAGAAALLACILLVAPGPSTARELAPWTRGATPSLSLRDAQGRLHDLGAYRGKVVLVNFWATWCEPCLQEMPSIEDLEARMKGRPFAVLAVNFAESRERVAAYLNNYQIGLTVLFDTDMATARRWDARILPASYLVGADGRVRYRMVGEADWTEAKVMNVVQKLLDEAARTRR